MSTRQSFIGILMVVFIASFVLAGPLLPEPPAAAPSAPSGSTLSMYHSPPEANVGDEVTFNAVFVDVVDDPIIDANCVLSINSNQYTMVYDALNELYRYGLSTLPGGVHTYTINCDGVSDTDSVTIYGGAYCQNGLTQSCITGELGVCAAGTQTCENNMWGICVQNIEDSDEICTGGLDEDCDGLTDEEDVGDCNDAPYWVSGIQNYEVNESNELIITVDADDPEGNFIIMTAPVLPSTATFSDLGDGQGQIVWPPATPGLRTVQVRATDLYGAYVNGDFTINVGEVNNRPELTVPEDMQSPENQLVGFNSRATDSDGDFLTLVAQGLPEGMTESVVYNNPGNLRKYFEWTPGYGAAGNYEITLVASDGEEDVSDSFTLTIGDVNREPVLNSIGTREGEEYAELSFTVTASDPDGDTITLSTDSLPNGAVFTDHGNGLGTFIWTPVQGQNGSRTIRFTATDNRFPPLSVYEDVQIVIGDVNRRPTLNPIGDRDVDENELLTIIISGSDPDEEDVLTFSAGNLPTGAHFNPSTRTFTWTPNANQQGNHQVTFTVTDNGDPALSDSEDIIIRVGNVNRAPVLEPVGNKQAQVGELLTFTLVANDADGDPIDFDSTILPTGANLNHQTGVFTWTPGDAYENSNVNITFFVYDNSSAQDSERITISVGDVAHAPVLSSIGDQGILPEQTLTILLSATDLDNDPLTFGIEGAPNGSTFVGNNFTWTPTFDDIGNHYVNFTVTDGELSDFEEVVITVGDINRPPVLSSIGDRQGYVGEALIIILSGSDPDGNALNYSVNSLPDNATLIGNIFNWTPNASTVQNITFRVSDGDLTDSETISVTVNESQPDACDDGTLYDQCSSDRPYYCEDGSLVERASVCGCPSGEDVDGESCDNPPSSSCFVAGTLITMADGSTKKIEDISAGEFVAGPLGPVEVTELEAPVREGYYDLTLDDGTVLGLTNEHPVYTHKGWSAIDPSATFADAQMFVSPLVAGDLVQTRSGWKEVVAIEHHPGLVQTYNLKKVEGHEFYAQGVLVHNKGGIWFPPPCTPDWSCDETWSVCDGGIQYRECTDLNSCGTETGMPLTNRSCVATCFDNFQNGDEEGIDCGGSCPACASGGDDGADGSDGSDQNGGQAAAGDLPRIVVQPLSIEPGLPVEISLRNDGLEAYENMVVFVGGEEFLFNDVLQPTEQKTLEIIPSLESVLNKESLTVSLYYNDRLFDEQSLPLNVVWPGYGVFLQDTEQGPKLYVLINNENSQETLRGVEAEVNLVRDGHSVYLDYIGPFKADPGEKVVRTVSLPERYLSPGDYDLSAQFYLMGEPVAESAQSFSTSLGGGFNFGPLIVILASILGVVLLYVGMDMAYNKKSFKDVMDSFKK